MWIIACFCVCTRQYNKLVENLDFYYEKKPSLSLLSASISECLIVNYETIHNVIFHLIVHLIVL